MLHISQLYITNMNMTMNNRGRSLSMTRRVKLGHLLLEQDQVLIQEDNNNSRYSNASSELSTTTTTTTSSSSVSPRLSSFCNIDERYSTSTSTDDNTTSSPFPYYYNNNNDDNLSSPWNQAASTSPYLKSPWIKLSSFPHPTLNNLNNNNPNTTPNNNVYFTHGKDCLVGSLLREEGHVYSLAANNRMLYTGSQSKNIRVWNNFNDAGGFKSSSGLVKAIVISKHNNTVFTGHQDGKIRLWSSIGKRIGTFPTMADYFRSSINPKNYVQVRRHHKVPRVKHFDAVSCMSLNEEGGLLYSGSWDKSIKVWRVRDGKCLESIDAHEDAINSIVVGFAGLLFSGSADGTVKVWRRELDGKKGRHVKVTTLLTQETAVTALAESGNALYAGSSDGLVNFWEREKEKEELCYGGVLRGHKSAVLCVATAGSLVMSGSADKTICVWKRQQQYVEAAEGVHSCLAVLSGHNGPVKCLAVEYEKEEEHWIVYSGSLDKSVKIWKMSEDNIPDNELPNLL